MNFCSFSDSAVCQNWFHVKSDKQQIFQTSTRWTDSIVSLDSKHENWIIFLPPRRFYVKLFCYFRQKKMLPQGKKHPHQIEILMNQIMMKTRSLSVMTMKVRLKTVTKRTLKMSKSNPKMSLDLLILESHQCLLLLPWKIHFFLEIGTVTQTLTCPFQWSNFFAFFQSRYFGCHFSIRN